VLTNAHQWDHCLSTALIRSTLGASFGVIFSVLLFKRRSWPVFTGLGVGLGRAWEECDSVSHIMRLASPDLGREQLSWVAMRTADRDNIARREIGKADNVVHRASSVPLRLRGMACAFSDRKRCRMFLDDKLCWLRRG